MTVSTAKVSSKGQITLPAAFRRELGTDLVMIRMEDKRIVIEPVASPGGALRAYAQPGRYTLEEETELATELEMREKHGKYLRR